MDRDTSLDLLREAHVFPGIFEFVIVVKAHAMSTVLSAAVAAVGPDGHVERVTERRSTRGNYVSLHLYVQVQRAEQVLDVYGVLQELDGVVKTI